MFRTTTHIAFLTASVLAVPSIATAETPTQRGQYLVTFSGCSDCHTPGYFFGKPDTERFLGGSDVGFEIPGLGVFVAPNITPDKETGIGSWTPEQITAALQAGIRPDGRVLAPIMPWHAFAHLTKDDAKAIVAYLQSLQPVKNKVPGPFKPGEKVTSFTFRILPPGETAADAPK